MQAGRKGASGPWRGGGGQPFFADASRTALGSLPAQAPVCALPVSMRVMTDMPERISGRRSCPGSKAIRTGMRWTTLVKLPDEVSLGSREKVAPVAG